jgi:hypothetical protein
MKKLTKEIFQEIASNNAAWKLLSLDYELSENLIRRYQDKVDWYRISQFQKLSEDFVIEFENKINFIQLMRNKNLSSYSEEFQRFLLEKLMNEYAFPPNSSYLYKRYFTDYMKKQYDKISIML